MTNGMPDGQDQGRMPDDQNPDVPLPPKEQKLLTPFRYLWYKHPELFARRLGLSLAAGCVATLDGALAYLAGAPPTLGGPDGAIAVLANPFGVFAGVYVGLVGVMYAVDNPRLDRIMKSAPDHPGHPDGVTVRVFIIDLLAYGAAAATATALAFPYLATLGASWAPPWWARPVLVFLLAAWVLHQFVTLLIGIRFMQKNL